MSLETHRVGTGVGNLRDLGGGAFPRSDKSSNLYTQLWEWRPFQLSQAESIDVNVASNAARLSIDLQIAIKFPVSINDSGSDLLYLATISAKDGARKGSVWILSQKRNICSYFCRRESERATTMILIPQNPVRSSPLPAVDYLHSA